MFWTMLASSSGDLNIKTTLKSFAFIFVCVLVAVYHNPHLQMTSLMGVICSVYVVITV
jgi:hypothetical protein